MRTKEEILKHLERFPDQIAENYAACNLAASVACLVEVAIDIRDLLAHPPVEVVGEPVEVVSPPIDFSAYKVSVQKQRDPLFDKAVEYVKRTFDVGDTIAVSHLRRFFVTTYGRASIIFKQLQEAGIISVPERGKAAKVL